MRQRFVFDRVAIESEQRLGGSARVSCIRLQDANRVVSRVASEGFIEFSDRQAAFRRAKQIIEEGGASASGWMTLEGCVGPHGPITMEQLEQNNADGKAVGQLCIMPTCFVKNSRVAVAWCRLIWGLVIVHAIGIDSNERLKIGQATTHQIGITQSSARFVQSVQCLRQPE